jgi:hypothetical protein
MTTAGPLGRSPASNPAWFYTAVLFEPLPVGGWIALACLAWLGLASCAAADPAAADPFRRSRAP